MYFSNKSKRNLVKNDYNAIADLYIKNCDNNDAVNPYINEFLSNLKGKNILDVGCGSGKIANYFSVKGFNVTALDFSEEMLKIASQKYPKINFINTDICDYVTTEKFDGIFSKYVLFHLPPRDLKNVLNNFYNMLKDNGQLCIISDIPKNAGGQILPEEFDSRYKVYYNYFTPDDIVKILLKSKFKINKKVIIEDNDIEAKYSYGFVVIYAEK